VINEDSVEAGTMKYLQAVAVMISLHCNGSQQDSSILFCSEEISMVLGVVRFGWR